MLVQLGGLPVRFLRTAAMPAAARICIWRISYNPGVPLCAFRQHLLWSEQRASKRVILIEPGLAQRLLARAQKEPHFDGIGTVYCKIELGAPVARHIVRHGFGEDVRESTARRPQSGLGLHAKREGLQRRAQKFDHEFAHAFWPRLAWLAAVA